MSQARGEATPEVEAAWSLDEARAVDAETGPGGAPESAAGFTVMGRRAADTGLRWVLWQPHWRAARVSQERLVGEGWAEVVVVAGILAKDASLPVPAGRRG